MTHKRVIFWFRQDLRITDNPAFSAACAAGDVLPIYILDDINAKEHKMGAASRVWLYHALTALNKALDGKLQLYNGDPQKIISNIAAGNNITDIYWNRCYEPWRVKRDHQIKATLPITSHSMNGSLLWEPWEVAKKDGHFYRVFTPFYRNGCLSAPTPRYPLPAPDNIRFITAKTSGLDFDGLSLLPDHSWTNHIIQNWDISPDQIQKQCDDFLEHHLYGYKENRNYPNKPNISRLSPALHFGQISPNQVWHAAIDAGHRHKCETDADFFCSELGWREFSYHLLYHFPDLPSAPFQKRFDHFPWQIDNAAITAWQNGQTGYPIIDAAMQELWQTGFMHNRLRMVVASFLVKNLLQDWRVGATWFWDCLFDADMASNNASWQWVAGCGADAAPYFRIFNPITQGEKFDPAGDYIRKHLPVLKDLPNKYIHTPWKAPEMVLEQASITLGVNYPSPMVDLKQSRLQALDAFATTKS